MQEHEGRLIGIAGDLDKLELAGGKGEGRGWHRIASLPSVQMQPPPASATVEPAAVEGAAVVQGAAVK